jgi:hypothetical protein
MASALDISDANTAVVALASARAALLVQRGRRPSPQQQQALVAAEVAAFRAEAVAIHTKLALARDH